MLDCVIFLSYCGRNTPRRPYSPAHSRAEWDWLRTNNDVYVDDARLEVIQAAYPDQPLPAPRLVTYTVMYCGNKVGNSQPSSCTGKAAVSAPSGKIKLDTGRHFTHYAPSTHGNKVGYYSHSASRKSFAEHLPQDFQVIARFARGMNGSPHRTVHHTLGTLSAAAVQALHHPNR